MKNARSWIGVFGLLFVLGAIGWLATGCASGRSGGVGLAPGESAGFLYRTNYYGWEDSIWVSNGRVEAIIVPAIGRVMQFRFAGEEDGPFWENTDVRGRAADPTSNEWLNFGGDKVWPSPQSSWGRMVSTNWPPPPGFDATPVQARVDGWVVTLEYPVDPHYGIRVTRRIELPVDTTMMVITTRFDKIERETLEGGIWVVTQLKDPVAVYARIPEPSIYPQGFRPMSGKRPPSLQIRNRLLSLQRDPEESHKIGLDVGTLLWVGERAVLRIDAPRLPYRHYPDEGASTEVYTHPDPLAYVELEMLGPISQMRHGDSTTMHTTYTLIRRREIDVQLEAARLLRR
jgi:hypothetical protein